MTSPIDARMTFDSFVVGPGNRLASAAARRAADSPAASYNPLFLYSASGLGKSHILNAMAHHSERLNPDSQVLYQTLEGYLDELADAIQSGTQEELKDRYRDLDILLLDDVQFLTGQSEAQELLLRTLDSLNLSGSQIVLASDRPPAEIDGLDARLLSRFSGGLMVDIAPPELETRVAIVRKKCDRRNIELAEGVAEQIARLPFRNVRELMGGLNRVLAAQELEGRAITKEDVVKLVDIPTERPRRVRRADRLQSHIAHEVYEAPEEPWQILIRQAAEEAEAEGFATGRLRRVLDGDMEPTDPEQIVADFHEVLDELRQIRSDLDVVGNPWPEAARGVLLDPDRVEEARALLASARERVRDFPPFPLDIGLHQLETRYPAVAVKAARQLIGDEPPEYNPLFVWSPDGHGARMLLEAAGASCLAERSGARVAFISAKEFAAEFIDALSDGVAGAWRERWWTVELLLVHGCQDLSDTERAQDEFFHLFEAVKRRGARVILAADRAPSRIDNVDDRLRSRFEGGLVVQAEVNGIPPTPVEELLRQRADAQPETLATDLDGLNDGGEVGPDLQVRRTDETPELEEPADPEFEKALGSLDGGSEAAAWTVPTAGLDTPEALTKLTVKPDDFPTLLSEQEKERMRAGIDATDGAAGAPGTEEIDTAPHVSGAQASHSELPSGEVAATTESAVGDGSLDPISTDPASQDGASSEASSDHPNLEEAPIVTAADLDPTAPATPTNVAPTAFVEADAFTVDEPAPTPAPPTSVPTPLPEDARRGPAHVESDDGALDDAIASEGSEHSTAAEAPADGTVTEASPETPVGPWVAEALPAVLEDELDHVIDSVFTAHTGNGAHGAEAATGSTPSEVPSPDLNGSPDLAPDAASPAPSVNSPPAPVVDHAAAPAAPSEYGFDGGTSHGADSGVATRTRKRRVHQAELESSVAEPAAQAAQARPDLDAVAESSPTQGVQADEAGQPPGTQIWAPSREKTVWDWPSIEARMVVEE